MIISKPNQDNTEKDKTETVFNQKQQSEKKLIGSIKPKKGHTLFEVNLKTGEIKKASFVSGATADFKKTMKGDMSGNKRVDISKDCVYVSCLNKKNIKKRLLKDYGILLK